MKKYQPDPLHYLTLRYSMLSPTTQKQMAMWNIPKDEVFRIERQIAGNHCTVRTLSEKQFKTLAPTPGSIQPFWLQDGDQLFQKNRFWTVLSIRKNGLNRLEIEVQASGAYEFQTFDLRDFERKGFRLLSNNF